MLGFLAFVAYPFIYSITISLTRTTGMDTPEWVGLTNYKNLFVDPLVAKAVGNTLFYAFLAVPIGLVVAVLLALAMNRNVKEVAWYRTVLYLPSLIPTFALSFIFIVMVNPQYGVINQIVGLFGAEDANYLGEPTSAKVIIVLMAQLGAGNAALIFLAGLNNIPQTLYEAAKLDGANSWQQFTRITIPLLTPAILFNLITGISGSLQIFTEAYVMTNGGPNNGTLFYMYYLYKSAFSYAQLGFASAMAVALFVVGMAIAVLVYTLSRKFVTYDTASG
jgi:multiple sugar transport system permease protein